MTPERSETNETQTATDGRTFLSRPLEWVVSPYPEDEGNVWKASVPEFGRRYTVDRYLRGMWEKDGYRFKATRSDDIQPFAWADTQAEIFAKVQADLDRCILANLDLEAIQTILGPFVRFVDVFDDDHIRETGRDPEKVLTTDATSIATGGQGGRPTYRRLNVGDLRRLRVFARKLTIESSPSV